MTDRLNELKARAEAGNLTEQEQDELVDIITTAVEGLPKRARPTAKEVADMFPTGDAELSDEENMVIDELDYHIQECFRIARAKAPSMRIAQVMSTMLLQMHCVIWPASKYNGIFYKEHYMGHEGTEILPDYGFSQLADHMTGVFADPAGYDAEHWLRPIGEHDFQYELDPAKPRPDGDFGGWLATSLAYYMQDPEQDYLKAPLAAARAKHATEPDNMKYSAEFLQLRSEATDYIKQGWLDDGMLEDAVGDTLAEYVYGKFKDVQDDTSGCEPNADAENPAGY